MLWPARQCGSSRLTLAGWSLAPQPARNVRTESKTAWDLQSLEAVFSGRGGHLSKVLREQGLQCRQAEEEQLLLPSAHCRQACPATVLACKHTKYMVSRLYLKDEDMSQLLAGRKKLAKSKLCACQFLVRRNAPTMAKYIQFIADCLFMQLGRSKLYGYTQVRACIPCCPHAKQTNASHCQLRACPCSVQAC